MNESAVVRQEMVEQIDKLAAVIEQAALDALESGAAELATDLWVTSARMLAASDELWQPVKDHLVPPPALDD
jgi:hypothetical protein